MKYKDLRDFLAKLESQGELRRITKEIDPHLEMTEICDRVLKAGGPAILFENPRGIVSPCLEIYLARHGGWLWVWDRSLFQRYAKWVSCSLL